MRNSQPQLVDNLINIDLLFDIHKKSKALYTLNNLLHKLLPEVLHQHCCVANYRQGVLIIHVASASWLTRLRYEQEKLRTLLRQHGLSGLSSLQFKVNPDLNRNRYLLHSRENDVYQRRITPKSAELLLTLAEHCSPTLKSKLIKLANHATT